MPINRYFTDSELEMGSLLEIKGAEFHHLAHVTRIRQGEYVELVNGQGILAKAIVHSIGKKSAFLKIEAIEQKSEPPIRLILAQAIPKFNRLDFILEKGTELGVDSFWLFPGLLSANKALSESQLERANLLTIAAMKQCGRLTLPTIELKPTLDQWSNLEEFSPFFGDIEPTKPSFEEAWKLSPPLNKPVLFITGPESGFTEKELHILNSLGARGVKLHHNVLRTDTASLAALSLISHWQLQ